jgi:hypothetical protein
MSGDLRPASTGDQRPLLTYALLVGLTPMIPIPFVDDVAREYFRKRLVSALAAGRSVTLAPEAVAALASEPSGCLVTGCLSQLFLFPLRLIFRTLFFFLEWKRVLDLTSQTYHFGYLVDCALEEGYLRQGSRHRPETVRQAITEVCREAPIRPVEAAIAGSLRQSRGALKGAIALLIERLREVAGGRSRRAVEEKLDTVDEEERRQVAGVVENLQNRMQGVPDAHFQRLREALRARLS